MYGFNPEKAKALLKEAGYGPGQLKLKILAFTEPGESEGPQVAEALGIYFKDVGIESEIEVLDWAKVREMYRKKRSAAASGPTSSPGGRRRSRSGRLTTARDRTTITSTSLSTRPT